MKSGNTLFILPTQVFITLYGIVMLAFYFGILKLLAYTLPNIEAIDEIHNVLVYFFISILYFILALVLGIYLYVVFHIPEKIARAFDPIKNDIAARRIHTFSEFGIKLVDFLCSFFDFAFFDIECAWIKSKDKTIVFSDPKCKSLFSGNELETIEKESMLSDKLTLYNQTRTDSGTSYTYFLPIFFEEQWIGYIGFISKNKLGKIYKNILQDFENNYLDDQLKHILNNN